MFDGIIFRLLFCGYIMWCRSNYRRSFCIPLYHELDIIEEEDLIILYDLKNTNTQFYDLHYRGEYNDTKPYLNVVAS